MSDHKDSKNNDSGFMESLTGIQKLKQDRVDLHSQKPKASPVKRQPKDQLSQSNDGFASIPETTMPSWFHHGLQNKLRRKIKMGQLAIDATLDLHGYRQSEAIAELESLLRYALDQQARFLIIIHGQGYRSHKQPILKPLVQHWLSQQEMVLAWCPAQPEHGGAGASYVYLKIDR